MNREFFFLRDLPQGLRKRTLNRGNAGLEEVYDSARLKRPLIRVGKRGEGNWRPASWDEAFDFTAKKLLETKEKYGPQGTLWSSTESFQEVFFQNLGSAFGSPNLVRHPTLCLASVNLAYSLTFGTVPSFDLLNSKYIIMSGANRLESFITPDTMDLIESAEYRKAKLIYLDPRFTVTASKADEWYPIRPGTDLAFILAMQAVQSHPFYMFDEIDAALDAINSTSLARFFKERSAEAQIIAITLRDMFVAESSITYGVYSAGGVSRVVHYKPAEVPVGGG
jgi:formylmethanofuran dehydrogenase subunit B